MTPATHILVEPSWLSARLGSDEVAVIDSSYFQASLSRDADAEFEACRIPGAARFDIDKIKDTTSALPHMLPSPEGLARALNRMGIASDATLVVYDTVGIASAPRVRWSLRTLGVADVRILSGGLPGWLAAGLPTESGPAHPRTATAVRLLSVEGGVVDRAAVAAAILAKAPQIVDARPHDRFQGRTAEPRPGLRAGHMPGARNVPSSMVVRDGRFLSADEIETILREAGVDLDMPMICSCGSGVTAAILATAVELTGRPVPLLYDGSWVEWASQPDAAIVTST